MNKRQRKKQLTRYMQRETEITQELFAFFYDKRMYRMKLLLIPHPRRHWMSRQEHKRRKEALLAELAAEKVAIREKLKTHRYTLGGWIPRDE